MPAERTKSWSSMDMNCHQLVWTAPVGAAPAVPWKHYEYESSARITEIDDDGPPPLVDAPPAGFLPPPPSEFIIFPPPSDEEKTTPKRTTHSKKKPENHIPRPPNAFILFRSSFIKSQHVSQEVETNHSTLSKIIGLTWKNLSDSERKTWHDKAKKEQEEHRRKFPKYAFRPQQTKGGKSGTGGRRKVREVEPKDMKRCAKIAELLVQGKKGSELDAEIAEFDKHHVPHIVTRFEAPITEKAFRRSSSAPIPDTELTIEQQSFVPKEKPAPSSRKVRSLSQRPTRASTPLAQQQPPVVLAQEQQLCSPLKEESSFDFSTFSFENAGSPASSYNSPCDPLVDSFAHHTTTYADVSLSIDTNAGYMSGDWSSQCSSPMTPSADFLSTPSPSPSFDTTPACDFGHAAFEKSFATGDFNHDSSFPMVYQDPSIVGVDLFAGMGPGNFGGYDMGMGGMDQYGLDAFGMGMGGAVPQYAF